MKKNKLRVIILFLIVIEGVFIYLNYKSYSNKENNQVFNEVKLADNLKGSKQIAIKQQKEDFTWEDKGTSMSAWPDIDTFEYYGSECTDASGNNITPTTDVIQFNEQTQVATISTSKTIYCTLSFARRSTVLKLMQQTTNETYLKTIAENDELLRYVGTKDDVSSNKLNNFICFGTENKDTCLNNKETYMYRIIGITTKDVNTNLGLVKDQLKIILAYPKDSTSGMAWTSGYESNITWNNAEVQTNYLNGTFLSSITGNVGTHQWNNLIINPKWYIVDNKTNDGPWTLTAEKNKTTLSKNYKVGLMYASDYYDGCNKSLNTNCWLYVKNGLSISSSLSGDAKDEWTMSRHGENYNGKYSAWTVLWNGGLSHDYTLNMHSIRPVFYLTNEISMSGGGTESDPFIISDRIVT